MKKIGKSMIFGILCILLSFAITMQFRFSNSSESESSQTKVTDNLKDQIIKLNDENSNLSERLQETVEELSKVRDEAAQNDSSSKEVSDLIKEYSIVTGNTDVEGQGIIIKYKPTSSQYLSDTAKDLRDIVNEIKNAGAEAISINDQRLISTSAIEMVKNKIEINGVQIAELFTIKAIGNSDIMYSGLIRPGGTVENIQSTGAKVEVNVEENVEIKKYTEE